MREVAVGAEVKRQYPTLVSSESLTNEYALQPILQYGELFVIIMELPNMPVQLRWFKHQTLNLGIAGSSPATGTKKFMSPQLNGQEQWISNPLVRGSSPFGDTICGFSSMERVAAYEAVDRGSNPLIRTSGKTSLYMRSTPISRWQSDMCIWTDTDQRVFDYRIGVPAPLILTDSRGVRFSIISYHPRDLYSTETLRSI